MHLTSASSHCPEYKPTEWVAASLLGITEGVSNHTHLHSVLFFMSGYLSKESNKPHQEQLFVYCVFLKLYLYCSVPSQWRQILVILWSTKKRYFFKTFLQRHPEHASTTPLNLKPYIKAAMFLQFLRESLCKQILKSGKYTKYGWMYKLRSGKLWRRRYLMSKPFILTHTHTHTYIHCLSVIRWL